MTTFNIDKVVSRNFGMNYVLVKVYQDDDLITTVKIHGGTIDLKDDVVFIEDQSEWLVMCMNFRDCVFSPECAL